VDGVGEVGIEERLGIGNREDWNNYGMGGEDLGFRRKKIG